MMKPGVGLESYGEVAAETVPEFDMFGPVVVPPHTLTNVELATRVRAALRADPRLTETQIEVVARGSAVTISGTAPGRGTSSYAADVAPAVAGVTEVWNDLVIAPGA